MTLNGNGGGTGTVFVRNISGGGATPDYVESRYYSNQSNSPRWMCVVNGALTLSAGSTSGNGCQWYSIIH